MMEHVQSHARQSEPEETGTILDWSDMKDQYKCQRQWKWPNNDELSQTLTELCMYTIDFVIKYLVDEKNEENLETICIWFSPKAKTQFQYTQIFQTQWL